MRITILLLLIHSLSLQSQSLGTNILFEQANTVFKGTVEKIKYSGSNAEGDDFGVTVAVEELYKNGFSGEKIGIRLKKLYRIDTILKEIIIDYKFQIKTDSTYIFFTKKVEQFKNNGSYVYFASLADSYIEALPYSEALAETLKNYDQLSYLKTNNYGSIPFKIMLQSSPRSLIIEVKKIEKVTEWNLLTGITESGKEIIIKTKGLNCICEQGIVEENQKYLFFLTPYDDGKYLLTDRWLGIMELTTSIKAILKYYSKE